MFIPGNAPGGPVWTPVPWNLRDAAAGVLALLLLTFVGVGLAYASFVQLADDGLTAESFIFVVAALGSISVAGVLARRVRVPTMWLTRIVLLTLAAIALAVGFSTGEGQDRELFGAPLQLLLTLAVVAVNVAVVVAFTVEKYHASWSVLGFVASKGRFRTFGSFGFWIAGLGLIAAIDALMRLIGIEFLSPPQNASEALESFGGNLLPAMIAVGVFVPIGEELFFRGFILPAVRNRWGPVAAVLISAMLFALFHVDPGLYLPTFILGVSLGAARVWTGSLWPSIMIHMAQNILALGIASQVSNL